MERGIIGRMANGKARWVVLVVLAAAVLGAAVWWTLPRLPGRLRQYLPEPVAALGVPPLPAALPAPTLPAAVPDLALIQTAPTLPPSPPVAPPAMPPPAANALPTPTLAPTAVPSPTPPPLPPVCRVDGLPIIPQKFNNCGPTNLTLVLNHYGVAVDQFDVAAVVRPTYEDRNVSPGELVAYVNDQTALAAAHYVGGDLALLRRLVAAGFPVIIEKGLEPDEATGWMGHYLTVYGYDGETRQLYVRDTYLGPWKGDGLAGYDDTERYWAQFNGAFVVVYPPERAGELAELLGPTVTDEAAMWLAAADRARTAVTARPDDAFAWFNLGTSLTALAAAGDAALYETAAAAFDQARLLGLPPRMLWYQFAPYEAYLAVERNDDVLVLADATLASQGGRSVEETCLSPGSALRAKGDEAGAREAFARAVDLNPTSPVGRAATAALGGS